MTEFFVQIRSFGIRNGLWGMWGITQQGTTRLDAYHMPYSFMKAHGIAVTIG